MYCLVILFDDKMFPLHGNWAMGCLVLCKQEAETSIISQILIDGCQIQVST